MANALYRTIDDLRSVVTHNISENVVLEYKRSIVLNDRDALCKSITAFANSVGGHFLLGIESQNGKPIGLDGGFTGPSKLDWIYKIINSNTFPPVETVQVFELPDTGGCYYMIEI